MMRRMLRDVVEGRRCVNVPIDPLRKRGRVHDRGLKLAVEDPNAARLDQKVGVLHRVVQRALPAFRGGLIDDHPRPFRIGLGDPHAAQGDGELGGTAIECSMTGTFQILLHKKADILRGSHSTN